MNFQGKEGQSSDCRVPAQNSCITMSELLHLIIRGSITALYYFQINWCSASLTFPTSASIVKDQSLQQLNFFLGAFKTFLLDWIWVQDLYKNVIFFPPRLPFLLKPQCNFKINLKLQTNEEAELSVCLMYSIWKLFLNPVNLHIRWILKGFFFFFFSFIQKWKKQ